MLSTILIILWLAWAAIYLSIALPRIGNPERHWIWRVWIFVLTMGVGIGLMFLREAGL